MIITINLQARSSEPILSTWTLSFSGRRRRRWHGLHSPFPILLSVLPQWFHGSRFRKLLVVHRPSILQPVQPLDFGSRFTAMSTTRKWNGCRNFRHLLAHFNALHVSCRRWQPHGHGLYNKTWRRRSGEIWSWSDLEWTAIYLPWSLGLWNAWTRSQRSWYNRHQLNHCDFFWVQSRLSWKSKARNM